MTSRSVTPSSRGSRRSAGDAKISRRIRARRCTTAPRAPLATKAPADYGVDTAPRLQTLKVEEPAKRQAGIKVADVDELIGKLKALGVVA